MAKSRSRKLKGRGIGPSKVAPIEEPTEPMEEEEPVEEETETIQVADEDARDRFQALVSEAGWSVEVGEVDGVFDTVSKTIEVIREDGKLKFILDGERTLASGEDLSREAEVDDEAAVEGASRRRLKKQARRTKRNRRNLKGKKLRKLTTRRR